jgi:hypothetical protein
MYRFIVVYIRNIIPDDMNIPALGYRALSGWGILRGVPATTERSAMSEERQFWGVAVERYGQGGPHECTLRIHQEHSWEHS